MPGCSEPAETNDSDPSEHSGLDSDDEVPIIKRKRSSRTSEVGKQLQSDRSKPSDNISESNSEYIPSNQSGLDSDDEVPIIKRKRSSPTSEVGKQLQSDRSEPSDNDMSESNSEYIPSNQSGLSSDDEVLTMKRKRSSPTSKISKQLQSDRSEPSDNDMSESNLEHIPSNQSGLSSDDEVLTMKRKRSSPTSKISKQLQSDRSEPSDNDMSESDSEPGDNDMSESDSDSDYDFDEESILRSMDKPEIFIQCILKSSVTKRGKVKRNSRIHNSYQYCTFCRKKVSNFTQHTVRNHQKECKVKEILQVKEKKVRQQMFAELRLAGNHEYNMKTIKKGKGDMLLERRPIITWNTKHYGPCPLCKSWMSRKLLWKHQKVCLLHKEANMMSTASIITQSDVLSERIAVTASTKLVNEVFSKMKRDEVGLVAREDKLIIALGNQWMDKNIGNKLKRGKYTSQVMRLHARFLLNLRKVAPQENNSLWDYLKDCHFEKLVQATLVTAAINMDDEEDLLKPSNAKKLGFDVKRSVNIKIGLSIIEKNAEARQEAEDLQRVIGIFWGTRVAKLARIILDERHFNNVQDLPTSDDLKKVADFMKDKLSHLNLKDASPENFKNVAMVTAAQLTMYNRRRSGEMESLR